MTGIKYASGLMQMARCDRCARERVVAAFINDGNSPGLRVCRPEDNNGCFDRYDVWRLPARAADPLVSRYPRPDVTLTSQTPFVWDTEDAIWDSDLNYNWDGPSPL